MLATYTVRFPDALDRPPTDRPRKPETVYPAVAQRKGCSDRRRWFDLYWSWHTLSAVTVTLDSMAADDEPHEDHPVLVVRNAILAYRQSLVDQIGNTSSKLSPSFKQVECPRLCSGKPQSSQQSSIDSQSMYSSSMSMYSSSMSGTDSDVD
ncbi:hypothetical protein BDZ89DRAFT_1060560 [Hymenopellis radicata]|nr:hypothetical protein BDZ89DRAFT_1060560 [Hymenopellis radicata]